MGGVRSPSARRRTRSAAYKCEYCGRKLASPEGVEIHQRTVHAAALREKKRRILSLARTLTARSRKRIPGNVPKPRILRGDKLNEEEEKPEVNVEKEMTPEKKDSGTSTSPMITKTEGDDVTKKDSGTSTSPMIIKTEEKDAKVIGCKEEKERKVEFKCPKCSKVFPVCFTAQRHIQKFHCVNAKGQKVNPNSPDLIKPIVIEQCHKCNVKFIDKHDCPITQALLAKSLIYECIGCLQKFPNMKMFHLHIAGMHNADAENMFFHTKDDFTKWLKEMENQTVTHYLMLATYDSMNIYCCSHTPDKSDDTTQLCTSSIIYQECPKGIQVHYYPNHSGHATKTYELSNKYKSYMITDVLEQSGDISEDADLYVQFKTLMENIVLDAAKININTLKQLVNKAIDMTNILSHYNEDDDDSTGYRSNKIILDTKKKGDANNKNIAHAIENLGSRRAKRSIDNESPVQKKNPRKSAHFTLADDKDSDKILKELDVGVRTPKMQSPSFNDTYKEFIGKNLDEQKKPRPRRVVKTKIGQFKPSPPKKVEKRNSTAKADIDYEVVEQDNDCNILVLKL